jgi:hypothetical protein
MRALGLLLLVACNNSIDKVEWTPPPADRSTVLRGEDLEEFCRSQERQPGWTCDDFANCETAYERDGVVLPAVCRAKG